METRIPEIQANDDNDAFLQAEELTAGELELVGGGSALQMCGH